MKRNINFNSYLLVFCKHLAGGEAHDASTHSSEHSHLEACESNNWCAETGRHEESAGYRNLTIFVYYCEGTFEAHLTAAW